MEKPTSLEQTLESTGSSPTLFGSGIGFPNISWTPSNASTNANSTLLFIAVEYVKETNEYKLNPDVTFQSHATSDVEQHVSSLDPNMSSVACYSPTNSSANLTSNGNSGGATIIQEFVSTTREQLLTACSDPYDGQSLVEMPSELLLTDAAVLKQTLNGKYLINHRSGNAAAHIDDAEPLQIVSEHEHEVELLITDQSTGVSYNVNTQEYLVDKCLADEQQLLDVLAPGPLLDSDLLSLDESLKAELPDVVDSVPLEPHSLDTATLLYKSLPVKAALQQNDKQTSKLQHSGKDISEDYLITNVNSIVDKPVPTRARSTLPMTYLSINSHNGETGVFSKKAIPKRTQFGPLEGVVANPAATNQHDGIHYFLEEHNEVFELDVSREDNTNWMRFVRKALTYTEQNLVLSQIGSALYFTTTKTILPKEELKVGYSSNYAAKFHLTALKPIIKDEKLSCFECNLDLDNSDALQDHLDVHDNQIQKGKIKKKIKKKKMYFKKQPAALECNICKMMFLYPKYNLLRRHLINHGLDSSISLDDKFNIVSSSHNCNECGLCFDSEIHLKVHSVQHQMEAGTELLCSSCDNKFFHIENLIEHIREHCPFKSKTEEARGYKCSVCYKVFASRERIQRHMFVHGSEDSKPLKCDTCDKRFLNNSALACHLKTHSIDKKVFGCPICKECFHHVLQLKMHVTQHCENGKYTCPHCKKIFKEYSVISKHIRAFHCDRKHLCPHCQKPFFTLDKLRMHLLRHSDHREFLCADCGKQFKRKDKLTEHTKRMHSEERENAMPKYPKKFTPKVQPRDYHRFIYKCHACVVGFKRRGMLVNHLAKRHPDVSPDSVPELNLPILRTTRDYYCQYCDKVYKSNSKRKAHILKNHPGQALPMSNRRPSSFPDVPGLPNPTFSQTVGSVTTHPQPCQWCHKQYASKAKLLQHQRKKHSDLAETPHNGSKTSNVKNESENETSSQDVEEINIDTNRFKRDFKVSDEELLSEVVALNQNRDEQYYQIVSLPLNEQLSVSSPLDVEENNDSRLYRLLTTGNGLVPPR